MVFQKIHNSSLIICIMVLTKNPFPTIGELVVCQVVSIQPSYVQVRLEDYKGIEKESQLMGMVHVSELSNRWVKNINSIVSIGSRVVLLVLRVNEERGYVDLSLRRVTMEQRTAKSNEWRYSTKAENLLKFFGEQHNITLEQLYEQAIWPLLEKYFDVRTAFEEIKEEGRVILDSVENIVLSPELKDALFKLIEDTVTISKVSIDVEFEIHAFTGDGINLIKDSLSNAIKIRRPKGLELKIFYIGAPIYRCEIEANDYPTAEKFLDKVVKKIESILGHQGTIATHREHLSNEQKSVA
jgi:translation initiation factor 2 subunit 1